MSRTFALKDEPAKDMPLVIELNIADIQGFRAGMIDGFSLHALSNEGSLDNSQ
jgi:hypothetical protein